MKKVILTFVAVLGIVAFLNAQELTSKKGFTILPEAGDWSISMDATPFLDFALNTVNIMNNTGQTSAHPGYVGGFNANVVGKYFVESDMAYRVKFGINTASTKNTMFFDDPADVFANPTETTWAEVSDVAKTSTMNILIGGGLEFRRGHNRLQGYYGGDVMIGIQTNKATNEWAVEQNQAAFDNGYTNNDGSAVPAARVLTNKTGTGIGFGVRGFIGAEYFFAPKMSIGAEFGWGLGIQSAGRSEIVSQAWDNVDAVSVETTTQGDKNSTFGFGVDNGMGNLFGASAALMLNLHF
jgi:hypothetical protein